MATSALKQVRHLIDDAGRATRKAKSAAVQSRLDEAGDQTLTKIQQQIEIDKQNAAAARAEEHRLNTLSDPAVDPDLNVQARTEDEYATRVSQFRDEKYASRVVDQGDGSLNMPNPFDQEITHQGRYDRWKADQDHVYRVVSQNPEMMNWAGKGAYKRRAFFGDDVADPDGPMVFYRMDTKTDPRGDLTPIQFDVEANEFGLHIGSRQAGMDIISPEVRQANADKMKALRTTFEGLGQRELFEATFKELRTNSFLRYGEQPFDIPSKRLLDEVVDEFFETLDMEMSTRNIEGLQDLPSPEIMKKRLRSVMLSAFDETQHPVMTNVKKGLHIRDRGFNSARNIANDLQGRGIFSDDELQAVISSGDNAVSNKELRRLLKEEGYDHLIYINEGEDRGVISIVLFDEANYQNLYKPTVTRYSKPTGHQVAASAILAPFAFILGIDNAELR